MFSSCKKLLIWFFIVISQFATAQNEAPFFKNASFGIKGYNGVFLARGTRAQYIKDSYPSFIELNVTKQTDGSKAVQHANNLPKYGFGFVYGNAGSKQYIGKTAALFSFIDVPLIKGKIYGFNLRLGSGVGWVEKPFDIHTNHKNLSLGSNLNAFVNIGLENEFKIYKRLYLNSSFSYMHLSNGKVKLPNLGVDMTMLSVGFRYAMFDSVTYKTKPIENLAKNISYTLYGYIGRKQTPFIGSPQYTITGFNAEAVKPINHFANITVGAGIIYDPSIKASDKQMRNNSIQGVAFGGYEHSFGKVSVPLHLGVYLYNKPAENNFYKSFGIRYRINNHFNVGGYLKLHSLNADFFYIGMGYKFL